MALPPRHEPLKCLHGGEGLLRWAFATFAQELTQSSASAACQLVGPQISKDEFSCLLLHFSGLMFRGVAVGSASLPLTVAPCHLAQNISWKWVGTCGFLRHSTHILKIWAEGTWGRVFSWQRTINRGWCHCRRPSLWSAPPVASSTAPRLQLLDGGVLTGVTPLAGQEAFLWLWAE